MNLKAPEFHGSADKLSDSLSVSVENAALCPRYIAGIGSPANLYRFEISRLKDDGIGVVHNAAVFAAHDTGNGNGLFCIGNDQHFRRKLPFLSVQRRLV